MIQGSLIIIYDGVYIHKGNTIMCSVGLDILCEDIGCKEHSTTTERFDIADNYQAEILGGLMV